MYNTVHISIINKLRHKILNYIYCQPCCIPSEHGIIAQWVHVDTSLIASLAPDWLRLTKGLRRTSHSVTRLAPDDAE